MAHGFKMVMGLTKRAQCGFVSLAFSFPSLSVCGVRKQGCSSSLQGQSVKVIVRSVTPGFDGQGGCT